MAPYLDDILARHRQAAAADRRPLDHLEEAAGAMPAPRPFAGAIRQASRPAAPASPAGEGGAAALTVIAEIKRRSPSKGALDTALDVAEVARDYERGGAACLSVLTDGPSFGGGAADLVTARAVVSVPVLRKDFTVAPADVCDARLMGADAVLLIAAALPAPELADLVALAGRLRLDALVEVHDRDQLEAALDAGATVVGVNQRDLRTFEVDRGRAERLRVLIPAGVLAVAESGIAGAGDARRLAEIGYDALLVGEHLIRSPDRAAAVAELSGRRHCCS